jgi:hypothetical protein
MTMTAISFQDLVKVNHLLEEIERLSQQVQLLEQELATKEQFFNQQIQVQKERQKQKLLQMKLLETIKQELAILRQQELEIASSLIGSIKQAIENFLTQGHLAKFIKDLLNQLPEARVEASSDVRGLLLDLDFQEVPGTGKLRVVTEFKDYIFDLDMLKPKLVTQLLIQKLSN